MPPKPRLRNTLASLFCPLHSGIVPLGLLQALRRAFRGGACSDRAGNGESDGQRDVYSGDRGDGQSSTGGHDKSFEMALGPWKGGSAEEWVRWERLFDAAIAFEYYDEAVKWRLFHMLTLDTAEGRRFEHEREVGVSPSDALEKVNRSTKLKPLCEGLGDLSDVKQEDDSVLGYVARFVRKEEVLSWALNRTYSEAEKVKVLHAGLRPAVQEKLAGRVSIENTNVFAF